MILSRKSIKLTIKFPIWDYASAEVIFAPAETSAVALGRPTRYRITPLLKRVATL